MQAQSTRCHLHMAKRGERKRGPVSWTQDLTHWAGSGSIHWRWYTDSLPPLMPVCLDHPVSPLSTFCSLHNCCPHTYSLAHSLTKDQPCCFCVHEKASKLLHCSGQLPSRIYPDKKTNCCLTEGISRFHSSCPRERDKRVENRCAGVWHALVWSDFQNDSRNHSLVLLFSPFDYKENSLAKGCEQFGKHTFPVTLQSHEGNTAWRVREGSGKNDGVGGYISKWSNSRLEIKSPSWREG